MSGPIYDTKNSRRGLCLVISNKNFESSEEAKRKGTERDEFTIKKTFEWLQFDVEVKVDLTAKMMMAELRRAANIDHGKYDMFVCFILSHGFEEGIFGTDLFYIKKLQIRKLFYGNKCKSLLGKPKLFFIQACRGNATDSGTLLEEDSATIPPHEDLGQASKELKTDGPSASGLYPSSSCIY